MLSLILASPVAAPVEAAAVAGHAGRRLGGAATFDTNAASAASAAPTGMSLVSRAYVPYGAGTGLAFGMGAAEQVAYDPAEKYAYAVSEQGHVNVVDYTDAATPTIKADYATTIADVALTDVDVCGGLLAVASVAATSTDPGTVRIYSTVKRSAPAAPVLLHTYTVGPMPDMVAFNSDCTKLATANEAEGSYDSGLVDPEGSVSIIAVGAESDAVTAVPFTPIAATDAALKSAGVHLPLEKNAQIYFDDNSAKFKDDLDFTASRAAYTPATQLEPEYVAWSADGTKIYVNLQENSAIVTIDVATATATQIKGMPLKDWSEDGGNEGLDTVKDDGCTLANKVGYKSMRMPDAIAVATIDGQDYILTADEGDDKEYGDFEEKQKFKDVIDSATEFDSDFAEFTTPTSADVTAMANAATNFDDTKMAITIGSSAIDYSDPTAPVFKGAVGFGGRGISIWNADTIALVWDSGSTFEKEQCAAYPWAHNGVADEEFAAYEGTLYSSTSSSKIKGAIDEITDPNEDGCTPGDDLSVAGTGTVAAHDTFCTSTRCACPLGKTVDERSLKDGAGPEAIVVGEACGRMLAVTATEKQGTAFVFDITTITAPTLLFVKHLSPASKEKNPSTAYADSTLGDVDPESITFLKATDSPTGNAGVMFAGAWSGTISFYEFTDADGGKCVPPSPSPPPPPPSPSPAMPSPVEGAATFSVSTTFSLSGSVSDYDSAAKESIKAVLADGANVSSSAVTIEITAGSVNVAAEIFVASAEAAETKSAALATGILASASALETALVAQFAADGVNATVTVEEITAAPAVTSGGLGAGAIIGIIIGGVVAFLALFALLAKMNMAKSAPTTATASAKA